MATTGAEAGGSNRGTGARLGEGSVDLGGEGRKVTSVELEEVEAVLGREETLEEANCLVTEKAKDENRMSTRRSKSSQTEVSRQYVRSSSFLCSSLFSSLRAIISLCSIL